MTEATKENKEEGIKYEDDEILTPENKKILKSLDHNEAWEIMKKVNQTYIRRKAFSFWTWKTWSISRNMV